MTKKDVDMFKRKQVDMAFEEYIKRQFPKKTVRKATEEEDTQRLIDYWIDNVPIQLKVKRCESRDDRRNIWVEFVTISGRPGWVLGDAKVLMEIKYSMNEGELCDVYTVDMSELAKIAVCNTIGKRLVDRKPSEHYVPYNRCVWGNKDIIARVPIEDMEKLKGFRHFKADKEFSDKRRWIETEAEKLKAD